MSSPTVSPSEPSTSLPDSLPDLTASLASTSLSRNSSHSHDSQHEELAELPGNDVEHGEAKVHQSSGGDEDDKLALYRKNLSAYIKGKYDEACEDHMRLEHQRSSGNRGSKVSGIKKMGSLNKGRQRSPRSSIAH